MFSNIPDKKKIQQIQAWLPELSPKLITELEPFIDFTETMKVKRKIGDPIIFHGKTSFSPDARQLLLELFINPKIKLNDFRFDAQLLNTILGDAVAYGNFELVKAVLKRKDVADIINLGDAQYGHTPLILAIQLGYDDIAIQLIQQGADVNIYDKEGNSSLHYACLFRNEKLINTLLDAGANAQAKNKEQISAADFYLFDWQPIHFLADTGVFPVRILQELRFKDLNEVMQERAHIAVNTEITRKMSLRNLVPSEEMLNLGKNLQDNYFKQRAWGCFLDASRSGKYQFLPAGFEKQYESKLRIAEGKDRDTQSRNAGKSVLKDFENEYKRMVTSDYYMPQKEKKNFSKELKSASVTSSSLFSSSPVLSDSKIDLKSIINLVKQIITDTDFFWKDHVKHLYKKYPKGFEPIRNICNNSNLDDSQKASEIIERIDSRLKERGKNADFSNPTKQEAFYLAARGALRNISDAGAYDALDRLNLEIQNRKELKPRAGKR